MPAIAHWTPGRRRREMTYSAGATAAEVPLLWA